MILFFVFFYLNIIYIFANKLNLQLMEETPPNSEIGSILNTIPPNLRGMPLQYVVDSDFFTVTDNGKLLVKKTIDLETLCLQHKLCCGLLVCTIEASILVNNKDREVIHNIEINVQILDKNDHTPKFRSPEENIIISEFTQIGTSISLTPAADGDATSAYRIKSYKLFEATDSFILDLSKLPSINLKVRKRLDYEAKSQYDASLQACDEKDCTTQKLTINIKDENDNQPIFERESYNFTIKEDINIGTIIGEVKANDLDSGKFGEIQYFISTDFDGDVQSMFSVELRTGKIRLQQKLSTNTRSTYPFRILAKDSDPLNAKQALCSVTIQVEDVNDHKPDIRSVPNSATFNISEEVNPRYITTLKIIDNDQGRNGIVDCRLDPVCEGSFELILKSKNVYSLKSFRKFDHEQEQKIDAIVICKDQGEPSLETKKIIPIDIIDVNEFRPYFKDKSKPITANVQENSPLGKKVVTVTALDEDKSADLRYQIDNYGAEYFEIDSKSGVIVCANNMLDREKLSSITFTVHVTDSLVDPKTASVEVRITVLDANDNPPLFSMNLPQFSVIENTEPLRLVGQINATDADTDENAEITFSLINTWNGHNMQRYDSYFHVVSTGYIETLRKLDREICDYYILEIKASDKARAPESPLTSTVNITLRVLDENDEQPRWTYPDLNTFNITDIMRPGDHLLQLQATDKDTGLNGKIRFDIIQQYRKEDGPSSSGTGSSQYFTVNASTGNLWISQILHSGTIVLLFRASDHGTPVKHADLKLEINISGDDSSNLNMTIIAVMITVTAVISLFLIVAIICVRRKPPKYHSPTSSILTKEQPTPDWIGLNSDESLIAYTAGNKSPYIANSHRPAYGSPVNDGTMQMHTFTPTCLPYEPIDGDSGDSGKGPSEEGSNPHHMSQEGQNYYTVRPPIRGTFRQCVPIPSSPSRSTCHCYVLPEETMIQPGHPSPFPTYSQGETSLPLVSPMNVDNSSLGYTSYNSLSLPRYHFPNSGTKFNNNSTLKFHHYSPMDSILIKDQFTHMAPSISSECSTPRGHSRLTPMHIRRVSEKELDPVIPVLDDRSSSLVTSTTSASSSTKTVLYNGPPTSVDVTKANSVQSCTESLQT